MMGCSKCRTITSVLFLVLGLVLLARDLGYWDFWNIQWATGLFLVLGVTGFAMSQCGDCKAMMKCK